MTFTLVVNFRVKDEPEAIPKAKALLATGSRTYMKDKGTLSWHVMQRTDDPRAFIIVERYEQASDLDTHRANPFYSKFRQEVGPLLDGGLDIKMANEHTDDWVAEAKL